LCASDEDVLAAPLDVEKPLLQVVQLAVAVVQKRGMDLGIAVGVDALELQTILRLSDANLADCWTRTQHDLPPAAWQSPWDQPFLLQLLQLALENRRLADGAAWERLQREVDCLHDALQELRVNEEQRLTEKKLAALAEFAAGAGHEINNPLAVISGQAQYVLKQLHMAEITLAEDALVGTGLEQLKAAITKSLHAVIGQTQRIHQVLTDMMQFARPTPPKLQATPVGPLLRDTLAHLESLADERQVRLHCDLPPEQWAVQADPAQAKTALAGLVRNAIEAAAAGVAELHVENGDGFMKFVVEDDGPGPSAAALEHLFDPFYSGRDAGRGRGMGLPTAWRLARQLGGDVVFAGHAHGRTRFILSLPAVELPLAPRLPDTSGNGQKHPIMREGADATVFAE
jgi:signal transduction histidine kinase